MNLLAREGVVGIYGRILELGFDPVLVLDHFRGKLGIISLFALGFVGFAFLFGSVDGVDFLHILLSTLRFTAMMQHL